MRIYLLAASLLLTTTVPALAQPAATRPPVEPAVDAPDPMRGAPPPTASDGGKATLSDPKPISDADDPLNILVEQETVDGLVLTLTIDRDQVMLDSASPARIPRSAARAERDTGGGDAVTVVGFAGGQRIGQAVVPDAVLNASEQSGLVRTERRQIVVSLAASKPVDRIEVTAPATNARATIDISEAWKPFCDEARRSPWCPAAR